MCTVKSIIVFVCFGTYVSEVRSLMTISLVLCAYTCKCRIFWCHLQAMARDPKNYYQETPKQIRRKILTFKSIPEQYQQYLDSTTSAMQT